MPHEELMRLLAVLGSLALWCGLIVAACLWEKRPIQPFYVPAEGEEYGVSATAAVANQQAEALGFRHVVACHDGKGRLYRVRYDFWCAPDDKTFAVVGSGTVAGIPVNGVSFYSRKTDGRILCTTNDVGGQDVSGLEDQATWAKLPLASLFEKHARRLTESAVKPFPPDSALAEYFDLRRRKADALVERSYAYYLDDGKTAWRYTLRGALAFYVQGTW